MGEMRISPEPSRMLVVGYVPDKATPEAVTEKTLKANKSTLKMTTQ
jgi:hypothetical protein